MPCLITLSLNLSRSLWFNLGNLRIILLQSPTLGNDYEQVDLHP